MSIIPRFFMEATVVLGRLPISNPRWCATGFVVGRYEGTQDGNEKFSTYLITNRHVVENEEKMVMQVNLQNGVRHTCSPWLPKIALQITALIQLQM